MTSFIDKAFTAVGSAATGTVLMEGLRFKIENFEGPLDLLLHLIVRHRMSLYDISIHLLIDQYLDAIGSLSPDGLDSASEFIEMAARLVEMKSLALLPRSDAGELERELVGQLMNTACARRRRRDSRNSRRACSSPSGSRRSSKSPPNTIYRRISPSL